MSIIIASQTAAANSAQSILNQGETAKIVATTGIDTGEDSTVEIYSEVDVGWIATGEVITAAAPVLLIAGPMIFRIAKPSSTVAYAIELNNNKFGR